MLATVDLARPESSSGVTCVCGLVHTERMNRSAWTTPGSAPHTPHPLAEQICSYV